MIEHKVYSICPLIPDDQVIHRSRKTRAAFYDAANQVEGEVITLTSEKEKCFCGIIYGISRKGRKHEQAVLD